MLTNLLRNQILLVLAIAVAVVAVAAPVEQPLSRQAALLAAGVQLQTFTHNQTQQAILQMLTFTTAVVK
jgi:hypothetical protein